MNGDAWQVMAVDMSYRLGWIDDSIVKRVLSILQQAKLPTSPPDVMTVEKFKASMAVRDRDTSMFKTTFFLNKPTCSCY